MAVPKRKTSKSKTASRKAQNTKKPIARASSSCSKCGAAAQPHHACKSCGYYNGRQVLTVTTED